MLPIAYLVALGEEEREAAAPFLEAVRRTGNYLLAHHVTTDQDRGATLDNANLLDNEAALYRGTFGETENSARQDGMMPITPCINGWLLVREHAVQRIGRSDRYERDFFLSMTGSRPGHRSPCSHWPLLLEAVIRHAANELPLHGQENEQRGQEHQRACSQDRAPRGATRRGYRQ